MAKALKKVYDRSYIVHVEQVNGQFQIVDTGRRPVQNYERPRRR